MDSGIRAPETLTAYITDPTTGLSDVLLDDLLANPAVSIQSLATLHFDAGLLDPGGALTWMTYNVESEVLNAALTSGATFSLLLSPADDTVSFNFSCRNQNNYPGDPATIWTSGPILGVVTVPEPTSLALLLTCMATGLVLARRHRRRRFE